ncbi:MAG: GNAT family N-acetyltransferase [Marinobacterium sp.]|jgi:Predicted acyltransferase
MPRIIPVDFEGPHKTAICSIRETVFVQEQGVPAELEYDGLDASAMHVLACVDDQPVGTGRILSDGHIGRIAVLNSHRGQGIGAGIVQALTEQAAAAGHQRVYLGAQLHATGFYERLGFAPYGETFMDAGIEHIHMEKHL